MAFGWDWVVIRPKLRTVNSSQNVLMLIPKKECINAENLHLCLPVILLTARGVFIPF